MIREKTQFGTWVCRGTYLGCPFWAEAPTLIEAIIDAKQLMREIESDEMPGAQPFQFKSFGTIPVESVFDYRPEQPYSKTL